MSGNYEHDDSDELREHYEKRPPVSVDLNTMHGQHDVRRVLSIEGETMSLSSIEVFSGDDWTALYVDGHYRAHATSSPADYVRMLHIAVDAHEQEIGTL
jgi:hypothetical protein